MRAASPAAAGLTRPAGVRARGWGWRYAGRRAWAVRGLDLLVSPGERVLLLGASGSGKSTVLAGLAGLLRGQDSGEPEGELLVDGAPARTATARAGLVSQDPETQLVMARAGDDVAFGLENRGIAREAIWPRVDAAFGAVGFPYGRDRQTAALSGGEKQRLALAGTVALNPGLLLLDEPTANLDPDGAALVRAAVGRVLDAAGVTLLVVEHRVELWLDLVERVVVLAPGGGVAADGPPAQVLHAHGDALAAGGVWVPGHAATRPARRSPHSGSELVLRAEEVSLTRPAFEQPAVDGADVALHAGEAVAVIGPNGSGKSTLAAMLSGLVEPTRGAVRVPGIERPLHRWRARDLAGRIGTVFQDPEHQFLTGHVADELALGPLRTGVPPAEARARAAELLEGLRLTQLAQANPFTLSGGEKRRLSVATALACDPQVLVLDEPTFGQDLRTWSELLRLLADRRDAGTALFVLTHDAAFVDALADRVLRMRTGVLT